MKEIECEIKRLECEIDDMLKKSYYFNTERVANETVFDVERLKVKINSHSERFKAVGIFILMVSIVIPYVLNTIFQGKNLFIGLVIYLPIVFWALHYIDKKHRSRVEIDAYALGLIDMLIERKKELQSQNTFEQN